MPPTTADADATVIDDILAVVSRHGLGPEAGARLLRRAARVLMGEAARGPEREVVRMVPGVPRELELRVLLGELTEEQARALGERD